MYKNKYREFIYCKCGCGLTRDKRNSAGNLVYYISGHQNRGRFPKRFLNYKHKGWIDKDGYILIFKPENISARKNRYVLEHRYLYEIYHNCSLLKWSHVHHKDGNRQNNSKENLEGMINIKHVSITNKKNFSDRFCLVCGGKTYIKNIKGRKSEQWSKYLNGFRCRKCHRSNKTIENVAHINPQ